MFGAYNEGRGARNIIGKVSVPEHTADKCNSCIETDVRELADRDTRDGIASSSRPFFRSGRQHFHIFLLPAAEKDVHSYRGYVILGGQLVRRTPRAEKVAGKGD